MEKYNAFIGYVKAGHVDAVKQSFIKEYIKTEKGGMTALHYVSECTNCVAGDIVHFLHDKKLDIEAATHSGKRTPLHWATIKGNKDVMRSLIEVGCILDSDDIYKQKPIHWATMNNDIDAMSLLIDEGCDLDCRDCMGNTPLDLSKLNENEECKELLTSSMEIKKFVGMLKNMKLSNKIDKAKVKTLIEQLVNYKNPFVIKAIKSKLVDKKEIKEKLMKIKIIDQPCNSLLKECLLYFCIRYNYQEEFVTLCSADIVNGDSLFMEPTVLETAVKYKSLFCVERIITMLKPGHESWERAVTMAKREDLNIMLSAITKRMKDLDSNKKRDLHTSVYDNDHSVTDLDHGDKMDSQLNIDRDNTPLLALLNQYITRDMNRMDNNYVEPKYKGTYQVTSANNEVVDRDKELERNMIEAVNKLIDGGASVNQKDSCGFSVLDIATECNNEKLLLALIHGKEQIETINKSNLKVWVNNKHFNFMKEVIPLIEKSLLTRLITQNLFISSMTLADVSLVKIMYDHASENVQTSVLEIILMKASTVGDKTLFEEMINKEMLANNSLLKGGSLLTYLILYKKTDFCKILLQSKNALMLLGRKNGANQLPLHEVVANEYWDIIDACIRGTTCINDEDNDGNTPLSLLLTNMSETEDKALIHQLMTYVIMLIRRSANIYHINKDNRTIISYCTKSDLRVEIESLVPQDSSSITDHTNETIPDQQLNHESDSSGQ